MTSLKALKIKMSAEETKIMAAFTFKKLKKENFDESAFNYLISRKG